LSSSSETVVSLVFDGHYEDAEAILRAERKSRARGIEIPRLTGLLEALNNKVQELGTPPDSERRILARTYMLAHTLRKHKYWAEAEPVYVEVVRLSLAMDEPFFLNDARLSRAVCLKELGRLHEYEIAKAQVPPGTTILIQGDDWQVEDL
jgi:hypothetical protein